MRTKIIDCCRNCIFYDGSDKEFAICNHPKSEERGVYNNIVSRSHFGPEPIPKWCPIQNGGYIKVKRDIFDKILSKKKYLIKDGCIEN